MMEVQHTDREPYLKSKESQKLELKSAQAIQDPRILPRAAVGFLNSGGGEIIIGVREVAGGMEPDAVPDVEKAQRIVLDRIVAAVEPNVPTDLHVEAHKDEHGGWLRILVPKGVGLHALRERHGGFVVYERVGDRQVAVPWSQVRERLRKECNESGSQVASADQAAEVLKLIADWRERAEKDCLELRQGGALMVCFRAPRGVTAELPADWRNKLVEWVRDPTLLGIRRLGWHYATLEGVLQPVQGLPGWFSAGNAGGSGFRWLQVSEEGSVCFATRLEDVEWQVSSGPLSRGRQLFPNAFVETIASLSTLAARLFELLRIDTGRAWGALLLTRLKAWSLRPNRPGTVGYEVMHMNWQPPYTSDLLGPETGHVEMKEFLDQPHRLAWILIRKVYESFGYEESDIPYYDKNQGRFLFE